MNKPKKYVFAIMPFNEEHDEIYKHIKPIFEHFNIECKRVDENKSLTSISKDIIQEIEKANLILADITGKNPNVFYELAIAHSFNKPTIMISQEIEQIPFDLKMYRIIGYENTLKGIRILQSYLKGLIEIFSEKNGVFSYGNPVWDSLVESPFTAILRSEDVLKLESNAKNKVCVLAPDIELGPSLFTDVMRDNIINKGIKYQYLVSNEPNVMNDYHTFLDSLDLGDNVSNFSGRVINKKFIESDVTIIDPSSSNECAFILAPSERPNYHFNVIGSSLHRLKNRFNTLWFEAEEIV